MMGIPTLKQLALIAMGFVAIFSVFFSLPDSRTSEASKKKQTTRVGLALLIALVTAYILLPRINNPLASANQNDIASKQKSSNATTDEITTATNSSGRSRTTINTGEAQRKKELERLKKQWLLLSNSPDNYDARVALAKESAQLLLASQQSIDLILFLEEKDKRNSISDQIEKLFSSQHAKKARKTLIDLPDMKSADGTNYREQWSGGAGMGCPEAEFETFYAALGGGPCSQEALFGSYQKRVKVGPLEAIQGTLHELEKKTNSVTSRSILSLLVNNLPDSAPFSKIEEILPDHYPNTPGPQVSLDSTRTAIFRKWAAVDRHAAFDYLMKNSDRLKPDLMVPITLEFINGDVWKGIEWIQKMPDGEHFDIAARTAINKLRMLYPEQAQQMADQITDPVARQKAYERIKDPYEEGQPSK